eukprot:TRINITY_DN1210_c1_g3_i2.p1 TRINITY_DN1210_c1_g3~~TRINITY_DN1210_c1_g3_i2.p1  ORF type:complete len:439 (+),score=63.92 TRINITY_DN1210_c1_g3_i2:102-1319(+)
MTTAAIFRAVLQVALLFGPACEAALPSKLWLSPLAAYAPISSSYRNDPPGVVPTPNASVVFGGAVAGGFVMTASGAKVLSLSEILAAELPRAGTGADAFYSGPSLARRVVVDALDREASGVFLGGERTDAGVHLVRTAGADYLGSESRVVVVAAGPVLAGVTGDAPPKIVWTYSPAGLSIRSSHGTRRGRSVALVVESRIDGTENDSKIEIVTLDAETGAEEARRTVVASHKCPDGSFYGLCWKVTVAPIGRTSEALAVLTYRGEEDSPSAVIDIVDARTLSTIDTLGPVARPSLESSSWRVKSAHDTSQDGTQLLLDATKVGSTAVSLMRVSLIAGATTAKSWQVETFTVDLASAGGGDSGGSEGSSRDANKCSPYQAVALPPMGGGGPSVLITCSTAAGYCSV